MDKEEILDWIVLKPSNRSPFRFMVTGTINGISGFPAGDAVFSISGRFPRILGSDPFKKNYCLKLMQE